MTEPEAHAWLDANASQADLALRDEPVAGRIFPADPPMWGPEEYANWSHDDLVWRIVFLQCVCRSMWRDLKEQK
jgi:hypothetical protein